MTPELAYFLKINVGIALFYAFYRLFFYKDTFFQWRRTILLCFLGISLLYPALNLQDWVRTCEPIAAMTDFYATTLLPEYTFTAEMVQSEATTDWQGTILIILKTIYLSGIIILFIRFLIQLISIIRLRIQCSTKHIRNTHIYVLNQTDGPFSFFRWIFIHPEQHTPEELTEILDHEQAHACQWHSIDVIFSELMCIACWFNPFIWLMKREIRNNLEYMADNHVLQTGHDYRTYQYHLLGLTHHKTAVTLYNSFNVLPLKNRIKMMNRKRTKEIGRTKYLMFLPLAVLLMIVSNIEAVARSTKEIAREIISPSEKEVTPMPDSTRIIIPDTVPVTTKRATDRKADTNSDDPVFNIVEEMPAFPGGQEALMDYINKSLQYPNESKEKGIQGRVITQFIVEKDGSISNCTVIRKVDEDLDAEAIRLTTSMPKWKPGKQRGKEVRVRYTIPVSFKLANSPEIKKEVKNSNLDEVVVVGYEPKEVTSDAPKEVYDMVDEMPKFPEGTAGLMNYLARSIKYPVEAQKNKVQGRVIVQMIITKDGQVGHIKVIRSASPLLDAEAIRVVSAMPLWEPGKNKGEKVAVKYTLPIVFKLQ